MRFGVPVFTLQLTFQLALQVALQVALLLALLLASHSPLHALDKLAYDLVPAWTAGLDDDVIFGRIQQLEVHPEGVLLVLDGQLNEVSVFDLEGRSLHTLGRMGEGPGEFNQPAGIFVDADGAVCVVQTMPARIVRFTLDGTVLDDLELPRSEGFVMLMGASDVGSHLVLIEQETRFDGAGIENRSRLVLQEKSSTDRRTLAEANLRFDPGNFVVRDDDAAPFLGRWAASGTGSVLYATHLTEYELELFHVGSATEPVRVHRDVTPRRRDAAQLAKLESRFSEAVGAQPPGITMEYEPGEFEPTVTGVQRGHDGEFWIRRAPLPEPERAPGQPFANFDRFDGAGQFLGEIELYGQPTLAEQQLLVSGGQVYSAYSPWEATDEDTVVHIAAFELRRR